MRCALLRERNAEGGSPEDPTGGHMNTPHTSLDRDVDGQAKDGELPQREGREIEGKEGYVLLVTSALAGFPFAFTIFDFRYVPSSENTLFQPKIGWTSLTSLPSLTPVQPSPTQSNPVYHKIPVYNPKTPIQSTPFHHQTGSGLASIQSGLGPVRIGDWTPSPPANP